MSQEIYDPLAEYANVFQDRFKEVAKTTFDELAGEAHIDVKANHETCREIYNNEGKLSSLKKSINWWIAWCVMTWLIFIGSAILAYYFYTEHEITKTIIFIVLGILAVIYATTFMRKRIKKLKSEKEELMSIIDNLKSIAWKQMEPLNRLYDWDILTRMMTKTVPRLEFDPYFTTQRLVDLQTVYKWDDSFNAERSVIYSQSGLINGNPFVLCRTRKMEMGEKTYTGSKTIHWTESERDANGKVRTVRRSEVLTASVTAPYPEYFEKTRLIYGNTAAPDLTFNRKQNGLAGKENSLSFKWNKYKLQRKARNLEDSDFAMMTNEEFEVAFNTSNRNNNQQFALLFTPLAQENMMRLLEDEEVGYGDSFDFDKNKMINVITAAHMQELNLDMNPKQYQQFDFDKAKECFYTVNANYFKAIYFALAPLLCVPMYQQIRPQHEIYGREMEKQSAFWEHEALANFYGQEHFKHPDCVTDCILKTEQVKNTDGSLTIDVHAYGYRVEKRLTHVPKFGGDGRMHNVPVHWDEYFPVTGQGKFRMKEDNTDIDTQVTQTERIEHINQVLKANGMKIYRRHIALEGV